MLYVLSSLSYDTTLIPHFIRYYNRLGVQSFIISVHELKPGILKRAESLVSKLDCDVRLVPVSERQLSTGVEGNNKEEIRTNYIGPEDWIIPADLDEFIQFPVPLRQLIDEMVRYDTTFIKGSFADRIAKDGCLSATVPDVSIWQQYPLAALVSQRLVRCWSHKVTLCRGDCMLASGHHNVIRPCRPHLYRYSTIHHFKWRKGLIPALKRRAGFYRSAGWPCYLEAERPLAYLERFRKISPDEFDAEVGWDPDA